MTSRSTLVARIIALPGTDPSPLRRSRTTRQRKVPCGAVRRERHHHACPPRRMSRGMVAGIWALTVALAVLLVITFLPTSYVIQRPGPVYNTLGTTESTQGTQVPLISVEGAETFPTAGALDLLTVQVVGNRERTPSWFELATAWFDPSRAVLPIDAVFPDGETTEERQEQSAAMMVDSQKEATAAALTELGYDVDADAHGVLVHRRIGIRGRARRGRRDPVGERRDRHGCRSAPRDRQRGRRRARRAHDRARRRRAERLDHAERRPRSTARRCGSSASRSRTTSSSRST